MEFFEAPAFTRHVSSYLTDDEYQDMQSRLATAPELGKTIPGMGGFRKLRWADPKRGKGTRGGLRVIYYYFHDDNQIWMMTLYDKDEVSDLTQKQKHTLKSAIEAEVRARRAPRTVRRPKLRR